MRSLGAAIACGLVLAGLPFFQSGLGSRGHGAFHMDHAPHHGGNLLMLGRHHLEIVEKGDVLELFVSDDARSPVQPESATIAFDGEPARPFVWSSYRMTVSKPAAYRSADYRIALSSHPPLTIRLPAGGVAMPR